MQLVENSHFYPTENLDLNHMIQELILFKILQFLEFFLPRILLSLMFEILLEYMQHGGVPSSVSV